MDCEPLSQYYLQHISVEAYLALSQKSMLLTAVILREKCPNTELFLVRIFLYSYRKILTRNNSVFRHFSRSVIYFRRKTQHRCLTGPEVHLFYILQYVAYCIS